MKALLVLLGASLPSFVIAGAPAGGLSMPSHFSDHAVLQRSSDTALWGHGKPGVKLSITLGPARAQTTVNPQGQWRATLNLDNAEPGPHTLLVQAEDGSSLSAGDILVGDVWLASGQSNMMFRLRDTSDAKSEAVRTETPWLREFRPAVQASPTVMNDSRGRWVVAKPPVVGTFGGVSYFFGKYLSETLQRPIGILHNSWSNTPIEPWISAKALETHPILAEDAAKARAYFEQQPKERNPPPLQARHVPGWIYNGMVAPFVGTTLSGFIWYQGESNAARAALYRDAFPLLITSWREEWGQDDLPFYFCQVANYGPKTDDPNIPSSWAELREAQASALSLPHTAMAVLIDAGEEADIHPRDKRTPGERLGALALRNHYQRDIPAAGPQLQKFEPHGREIHLHFTNTEGDLIASPLPKTYRKKSTDEVLLTLPIPSPDSALQGFALCGSDYRFYWANARIEGDRVVVSSPDVPHPVAVRYAWANNPTCNLANGAGFPAAPFRTDAQPLSTQGKRLTLPR